METRPWNCAEPPVEPVLIAAAAWLDAAGLGPWVRGSANVYPWTNVAHVLGVAALVGSVGIMDLRLAGLWRAIPSEPLVRALTPIAIGGFLVMSASGTILFASDGPALAQSGVFQVKLCLILLAAANAAAFRWRWRRGGIGRTAQALAVVSFGLWVAIVVAGRMIAYS